jgi:predicted aspartyl protease
MRQLEVEALIDAGANRLLVPKEVAEKLGAKPMFKVGAVLAGGSVGEVDACPVFIEMVGRGAPGWAAVVEEGEAFITGDAVVDAVDTYFDGAAGVEGGG